MLLRLTLSALLFATLLPSCTDSPAPGQAASDADSSTTTVNTEQNPFFAKSDLYMQYPDFAGIHVEHYRPAFERGMEEQIHEIESITNQQVTPDFDNTIVAMERSGQLLDRVSRVFSSMTAAHTNDELKAIDSEMSSRLSAHNDRIFLTMTCSHGSRLFMNSVMPWNWIPSPIACLSSITAISYALAHSSQRRKKSA